MFYGSYIPNTQFSKGSMFPMSYIPPIFFRLAFIWVLVIKGGALHANVSDAACG